MKIKHIHNDGGRAEAGFKGTARDCVCRAIAIATNTPYKGVYRELESLGLDDAKRRGKKGRKCHPRTGVGRRIYEPYLLSRGWSWTPTMGIGTGCRVHLRKDELPSGTIIVRLSRHLATVIDGELHDTYDSSRDGSRCVYGYFSKQ